MSKTNKAYVVTKYWDNGESWEDNYSDEKPVKVFSNLFSATTYCENRGEKIENATLYENQVAIYRIIKTKEYTECPIGKDFRNCDYEYDEDYCDECYGKNHDTFYDCSFEELRVYEVEMGD